MSNISYIAAAQFEKKPKDTTIMKLNTKPEEL